MAKARPSFGGGCNDANEPCVPAHQDHTMDNLTYLLCVSGLSPYYIEIIVMHELNIRNASARSKV